MSSNKKVIVIGAGPAGLTAAYELAKKGTKVTVIESTGSVGGMAKSFELFGQIVDCGPHRFFSSDKIVNDLFHEVVQDESAELKLQLEQNQIQLDKSEKTAEKIREKTLLEHFGRNTQCVYYGSIDNLSDTNERLLKFGNSNNLAGRVAQHRETYTNFRLLNAFKVDNKLQVENEMKEHPLFSERQRTITIKSKNYVELLSMNDLTFTILDKTIRDIILSNECNPDNFKKLMEENKRLKALIKEHDNFNHMNELVLLRDENKKLKSQNLRIITPFLI